MQPRFTLLAAGVAALVARSMLAETTLAETTVTRPVVSLDACPIEVITATTRDRHQVQAVVRKPPGKGPFPAVILVHASMLFSPLDTLKLEAEGSTRTITDLRFLAAGYVTVTPTGRGRKDDPLSMEPIVDLVGIVDYVKTMDDVDPQSIVLFGGSGGGSMTLETAAETDFCAAVVGEPATVLFTGLYSLENLGGAASPGAGRPIIENPQKYYTSEVQEKTRARIQRINCPILILHGDQHNLKNTNFGIFIPELVAAGKDFQVNVYPGQPHGFYWGREGDPEAGQKSFDDAQRFLEPLLKTKPRPLDDSLIVERIGLVRGPEGSVHDRE